MSDDECVSVDLSWSDDDEYVKPHDPSKGYGYLTTRLHPMMYSLIEGSEAIINHENKDTLIQTKESVEKSVKAWGPSIVYVKDEFITYELCRKAIENNSSAICSIKPRLLTESEYYNLCMMSVSHNGCNLKLIPNYVQTQELVDVAIQRSCIAIPYCLRKYKTYEMCLSVVKKNGQLIRFVPKKFINEEICTAAVRSRHPCLNYIPKYLINRELCEIAVKSHGGNIEWVPDEFMSSELGYVAVTTLDEYDNPDRSAINIKHISAKYITLNIITESVKHNYTVYNLIPKECLTDDVDNAVLDIQPYCIKYMKQTPEKCMRALKQNPYIIWNYIEKKNITNEMIDYVLSLQYVKHEYSVDFLEFLISAVGS